MPLMRETTDISSTAHDLEDVKLYDNAPGKENVAAPENDKQGSNFWERRSVAMAERPWAHCCTSLILSLVLGVGGLILGGFTVTVDGAGWESRGTLISDRHMQFMLVDYNAETLYNDESGETWANLIENRQENFFDDDDGDRRLVESIDFSPRPFFDSAVGLFPLSEKVQPTRKPPFTWTSFLDRRLQAANDTGVLQGCDATWYTSGEIFHSERLWPVWRLKNRKTDSFFNSHVLQELCEQEELTQKYLIENKLCFGCNTDDRCLPPYSPVLYARLIIEDGMNLNCQELAVAWDTYKDTVEDKLVECVVDLKADYNPDRDGQNFPASCPEGFSPTMLDELYDTTNRIQYTSSIFATSYLDIEELYESVENFARGEEYIEGAYDTQDEDFVGLSLDAQLLVDMSLALASAFLTTGAMIFHTQSLFLAMTGLLQITLSFPLAYTVYTFLGQLDFFPFLNFIGVFVIFALGADDVFVAVDKWKNARLQMPNATVQDIAKKALPDAASAMLLTTATTAVAFLGTAICPVAPIRCFSIFVALMIIFDYLLCIAMVFPALAIYDNRRSRKNCFFETTASNCCGCIKRRKEQQCDDDQENNAKDASQDEVQNEIDENYNLIRRILSKYYALLHSVRWPLLVICGVAFILTAVRAASLDLPTSSDVRLYDENDNQFEQNYVWRQHLLYDVLDKKGGSTAFVIWGVKPEDNGDVNNPDKWSSLVLDDSFQPSHIESQIFLRDFCNDFFENDFAGRVTSDYVCPINRFDFWLKQQSASASPDSSYQENCGASASVPIDPNIFDSCISAWAKQEEETTILS